MSHDLPVAKSMVVSGISHPTQAIVLSGYCYWSMFLYAACKTIRWCPFNIRRIRTIAVVDTLRFKVIVQTITSKKFTLMEYLPNVVAAGLQYRLSYPSLEDRKKSMYCHDDINRYIWDVYKLSHNHSITCQFATRHWISVSFKSTKTHWWLTMCHEQVNWTAGYNIW